MISLWKRFTAWLYCLRHPCTIITMDDAPAKGVNITFSYTGEYPDTVENMQEALSKAMRPLDGTFKFSGHIDGEELAKHLDTNLLPALQKRADERAKERETGLKQAMDWSYGEPFKFGERANTLLEELLVCGEHNRKLEESMNEEDDNEVPQEPKYGSIDYVDYCMNNLGMSLNFADPDGSLSSKGYKNDNEKQIWQAVLGDYRTLSDAIAALRKEQHGQEDQEERPS